MPTERIENGGKAVRKRPRRKAQGKQSLRLTTLYPQAMASVGPEKANEISRASTDAPTDAHTRSEVGRRPTTSDKAGTRANVRAGAKRAAVGAVAPAVRFTPGRDALVINGRVLLRADRVKAVRRGLAVRRARLERSMAHWRITGREPRQADLERWAAMRADVAVFENLLELILAGHDPEPSPRTGSSTRELPDAIA